MFKKNSHLVLFGVLLILAFVAGFKFFASQKSSLDTSEFTSTTDSLLQKHLAAQSAVTSYRVVSYSSGRGTTTTQVQIKNEKFMLAAEDFIIVDKAIYYYSDGKWQFKTLDESTANQYLRFDPREVKKELVASQTTSTFKKLGEEPCGDEVCYKYQQTDTQDPEAVRTFWFGKNDYLLRRDEFKYGEFTSENSYTYLDINLQVPEISG